ncbi:MAG: adenylate/guanylate cyclase domain-containing protein [Reyranella sp.]
MATAHTDLATSLLREREARSLVLLLTVVLASFVAQTINFWLQHLVRPDLGGKPDIMTAYLVVSTLSSAVLLYLLHRRQWIDGIGLVAAFFAASFAATAGVVMWQGYAPDAPVVLLTKLPVTVADLVAIAGMALTLRPLYVVITGAGVLLTQLVFYLLAANDGATVVATRPMDSYMGPALGRVRFAIDGLFVASATAATAFATHLARRTVREAVALQRTRDHLSRYFSPEVAAEIAGAGEDFLQPGGREQEIAVLFADLQGFTRLCAGMPATEAFALLAEYHARMVAEIFAAGGTLDKFTGDGLMATFGTPDPAPDAADRAVRAALAMTAALAALNRDRTARGQPALVQRIGIHAGPALVGNVGTAQRLEYTVIGDTVNVASRIERACKTSGRPILISDTVFRRLGTAVATEPFGAVVLDGQPHPIELHALRT